MPYAVTHVLVPLVLAAWFKDVIERRGRTFPLHYVLIAGLAGIIPDLDVVAFWVLHFFGFEYWDVHKTIAHTVFIPLLFVVLGFLTRNVRIHEVRVHKLKTSVIFYMLAFGSFMHLVLDGIFGNMLRPLYPLSDVSIGLNLVSFFPQALQGIVIPSLEAALLILWLIWLEVKHKVSDFI